MEKKVRQVVRSNQVVIDLADIYQYGLETFGPATAEIFLEEINHSIHGSRSPSFIRSARSVKL